MIEFKLEGKTKQQHRRWSSNFHHSGFRSRNGRRKWNNHSVVKKLLQVVHNTYNITVEPL